MPPSLFTARSPSVNSVNLDDDKQPSVEFERSPSLKSVNLDDEEASPFDSDEHQPLPPGYDEQEPRCAECDRQNYRCVVKRDKDGGTIRKRCVVCAGKSIPCSFRTMWAQSPPGAPSDPGRLFGLRERGKNAVKYTDADLEAMKSWTRLSQSQVSSVWTDPKIVAQWRLLIEHVLVIQGRLSKTTTSKEQMNRMHALTALREVIAREDTADVGLRHGRIVEFGINVRGLYSCLGEDSKKKVEKLLYYFAVPGRRVR